MMSFLFSQENKIVQKNELYKNSDTNNIEISEDFLEDNLFEQLLTESKLFYADAIMSDLQGDSLNALYYFDNLFKALAQLEEMSKNVPEIAQLKYQNMLSASIEYYDNKVISIDHAQSGFSTAVFKDKLEDYMNQTFIPSKTTLDNIKSSSTRKMGQVRTNRASRSFGTFDSMACKATGPSFK